MSGSPSGQVRQGAESALLPPDPSMQDILASIRRILSEDETATAELPGEVTAPPGAMAGSATPPGVFRLDETMLVQPPPPRTPPPPPPPEPAKAQGAAEPAISEDEAPEVEVDLVQMILGQTPAAPAAPAETHEPEPPPPAEAAAPAAEAVEPAPMPLEPEHEPPVPPALDATMPDHPMTHPPDPTLTDLKPVAPGEPLVAAESAAATQSVVAGLMRQLSSERTTPVFREGPTIEDLVREEMRPLLKHWLDTHLPPMVERLVRSELDRLIARAAP
jgi:cell pole-organizing protein PopZ